MRGSLFIPPSEPAALQVEAEAFTPSLTPVGGAPSPEEAPANTSAYSQIHVVPAGLGGAAVAAWDRWEEALVSGCEEEEGRVTVWRVERELAQLRATWRTGAPVRAVHVLEGGVAVVQGNAVRMYSRGGVAGGPAGGWPCQEEGEVFASCAVGDALVAVGGTKASIEVMDAHTMRTQRQVATKGATTALCASRNDVYAGHVDGRVGSYDARTMRIKHSFFTQFHAGISSVDVNNNLLACCGFASSKRSVYLDGIVRIFDVRVNRNFATLPFPAGASRVRFHPLFSDSLMVMSETGHVDVLEVSSGTVSQSLQLGVGDFMNSLEIAKSGEMLAAGSAQGTVHVLTDRPRPRVNLYSRPFAEVMPFSVPQQVEPVAPTEDRLLSEWPSDLWVRARRPTVEIPQRYLDALQEPSEGDFIRYAMLPWSPRYVYPWEDTVRHVQVKAERSKDEFQTQEELRDAKRQEKRLKESRDRPPPMYQRKQIQYNYMVGADQYLRSVMVGLENALPCSYTNGIVQMLFHLPPVRAHCMQHLCEQELCLTCELGFLFHAMSQKVKVFESKNFQRALSLMPEAKARGLVAPKDDEYREKAKAVELTADAASFIVERTCPQDMFQGARRASATCKRCGHHSDIGVEPHVFPQFTLRSGTISAGSQLTELLQADSVVEEHWCDSCGNKQPSDVVRHVDALPPVLYVRCGFSDAGKEWVPSALRVQDGVVEEVADGALAQYRLVSALAHIHDPTRPGVGHSVLLLRGWYALNDFDVRKTSQVDALSFDPKFKSCVALVYVRTDYKAPEARSAAIPPPRGIDVQPGELLAIDTEFVALAPQETRTRDSGKVVVVRPIHLSLARASIVRVDRSVLMDDYIETPQPVHDYLTRFSGIVEGQLTRGRSDKHLVSLKQCYLKMRYLIDCGCIFVGHGLEKDFRTFNLYVPPAQIRDTVNLFHLPSSRRISLRFLASYLLGSEIQGVTHDSIEDANTALALYEHYQHLVRSNRVQETLQELYAVGHTNNWKSKAELNELTAQLAEQLLESEEK